MYKKFGIAALILAFVLTGCRNSPTVSINSSDFTSTGVENSTDNSTNSTNSSTTDTSASSTVSTSSDVENSSDNSTSSTSSESSLFEEPTFDEQGAVIVSHDPQNGTKFSFDGLRLTITGKIPLEGIDYVTSDRYADINLSTIGDEFTVTIDFYSGAAGFTTIRVFEKSGSKSLYRLKFEDGKVGLPDCSEIAEKNTKVAEKAVEQSLEQVSEYVAIGSDKQEVRKILQEVKTLSNEICAGISDDYDKLRAIENWVANNIYYDYPAFSRGVPEETITLKYVLENKTTVCGGYSNLTAALAAAQGIRVYNVHGTASEGVYCMEENPSEAVHEFNFAVIDGRIIWLDADMDSRSYFYENLTYHTGKAVRRHFDIDGAVLALTHRAKYAEHRDYFALLDD